MEVSILKPIQTYYKGCCFRSRLEARWAVFFDACGVKWEYEPEGYDLGDGVLYLPDFLVHGVTLNHMFYEENCDIYVEVKGKMNDEDADKIIRFAEAGYPVLVVGNIPYGKNSDDLVEEISDQAYDGIVQYYNFETIDGDYFGAIPGIGMDGCFQLFGHDGSYLAEMNEALTLKAYYRARQARFEHGEKPYDY